MTNDKQDWVEYWAVYTEANGAIMANEFHSGWQARKFKQVTEQMIRERGLSDSRVWIEHGQYDSTVYMDFRQDITEWDEDNAGIQSVQIK